MKLPIYMDHNATTPVDPRVLDAMLPYLRGSFGNAASRNHSFGWEAERAVEQARGQIATVIGASAKEIIWTSGATESNNIAIKGVAAMYRDKGNHIVTQATEHKAVLDPCEYIEEHGCRVTVLPVDQYGVVDPGQLREAITDQTILVSIMHGNNEIGTIQPIGEIGALCKDRGVLFHTDASQSFATLPINVDEMGVDLLSCSGHKIYGPKGVGALYVRRKHPRVRCEPVIHGGGHERGLRSGTLNVPAIVGMGKAAELCGETQAEEIQCITALRDRFKDGLFTRLSDTHLNGHPTRRIPNNLNVSFKYVEGESLMMGFSDIAASSGSACMSAPLEPSYVLEALGVGEELAQGAVRFSIGRFTTEEEVDYAIERVCATVEKLRAMSPTYEMAREKKRKKRGQATLSAGSPLPPKGPSR